MRVRSKSSSTAAARSASACGSAAPWATWWRDPGARRYSRQAGGRRSPRRTGVEQVVGGGEALAQRLGDVVGADALRARGEEPGDLQDGASGTQPTAAAPRLRRDAVSPRRWRNLDQHATELQGRCISRTKGRLWPGPAAVRPGPPLRSALSVRICPEGQDCAPHQPVHHQREGEIERDQRVDDAGRPPAFAAGRPCRRARTCSRARGSRRSHREQPERYERGPRHEIGPAPARSSGRSAPASRGWRRSASAAPAWQGRAPAWSPTSAVSRSPG